MTDSRRLLGVAFFFVMLLGSAVAQAASAATLFARANAAYAAQDYTAAIAGYQALIGRGKDTGWVHYNLGNSYMRAGQVGHAIASFQRSAQALPRSRDVRHNLDFARAQIKDALEPPESPALWQLLAVWHYALNLWELCYVTAAVHALFWLSAALRVWYRGVGPWQSSTVVLGLMLALSGSSLALRCLWPQQTLVVKIAETEVHSGTSYDTVVLFKLHEGAEAEVVASEQNWLRLRLSDGKQGWLPSGDVELIRDGF